MNSKKISLFIFTTSILSLLVGAYYAFIKLSDVDFGLGMIALSGNLIHLVLRSTFPDKNSPGIDSGFVLLGIIGIFAFYGGFTYAIDAWLQLPESFSIPLASLICSITIQAVFNRFYPNQKQAPGDQP